MIATWQDEEARVRNNDRLSWELGTAIHDSNQERASSAPESILQPCVRDIPRPRFLGTSWADRSSASQTVGMHPHLIPPGTTTLIVRNIPARCKSSFFIDVWPPLQWSYNMIYIPFNLRQGHNSSYAFINFQTHADAVAFHQRWNGELLPCYRHKRRLNISASNSQGMWSNNEFLSGKLSQIRAERHFPVFFELGERLEFWEIVLALNAGVKEFKPTKWKVTDTFAL
eukprot:TRINITY_DN70647_c0_g1_i1.p1 TRINITY_DN70647_c0_g1~~TRINITY_DN70647_c0_g1_i1.p1  ORF type:complete len:242 (-),score=25.98 TRINITY_DN70647_c0_g1_i1:25-705(-)